MKQIIEVFDLNTEQILKVEFDGCDLIKNMKHDSIHGGSNRKYFPITKICPVCKQEFVWTPRQQCGYYTHNKTGLGPFCSRNCAGKITGPMSGRQKKKSA